VYLLNDGQAAYYYAFNLLMLLLVGLLASYLAERLQRAGGEVEDAERRAAQAERMAALGRLAAGLAHEIRNPIGSISASVQMLKTGAKKEEDRQLCDIVLRESSRLDELVTDMVDLSKPRRPERVNIDVGRIASEVVQLSSRSGRGAGDVEVVRLGDESAVIHADSGQIRQLVWNLVRNALQASGSGGQVRVKLESTPRARLMVEDDGVGIDSEAMEQLFDAFFTTRSKGTGLGLAVVKRIVDEHGFDITVSSDEGEGAAFIVDFGPPLEEGPVA
jgi:signal transduction histidine kinase